MAKKRSLNPAALARRLRGDLDWITLKSMDKDRTQRYATAAELRADLERHRRHEPVLAGPPHLAYRVRKFARKHAGLVTATLLILVTLIAGTAVSWTLYLSSVDARESAQAHAKEATEAKQVADKQRHAVEVSRAETEKARRLAIAERDAKTKANEALKRMLARSESLRLLGESSLALSNDAALALLLALEADSRSSGPLSYNSLKSALSNLTEMRTFFHPHSVDLVVPSPDGQRVATLTGRKGEESTVWLWEVESNALTKEFSGQNVINVSFSPLGNYILTLSRLDRTKPGVMSYILDVWETHGDQQSLRYSTLNPPGPAISPDEKLLALSTEKGIRLLEFSSKESRMLPCNDVDWMKFRPDGKLVTRSTGGLARVWDPSTGSELCQVRLQKKSHQLIIGPKSRHILEWGPCQTRTTSSPAAAT